MDATEDAATACPAYRDGHSRYLAKPSQPRRYAASMPFFICPNCKNRSLDHDGKQGMLNQAVACERCGFGFLFELLDDYYPGPNAGLVACDGNGRILAAGRGVFELTGFREAELMGKEVVEAFGLAGFEAELNPVALALEWGVRRLDERIDLRTRAGSVKAVTVDVFPGYDSDGGLLVSLSPRRAARPRVAD